MKSCVYDVLNQLQFCFTVLFTQAIFHDRPQVFYRIEVWRVARPFQNFHSNLHEMWRNNLGLVAWGLVVMRNGLMMDD